MKRGAKDVSIIIIKGKKRSFLIQKKYRGLVFFFDHDENGYDDFEIFKGISEQMQELLDIVPRVYKKN